MRAVRSLALAATSFLIGFLVLTSAAGTTIASSLTLNQPSPAFGGSINFTAVYPKEATRQLGSRQHENPDVQVDCQQTGVAVARFTAIFASETRNPDGSITGISSFVALGPYNSNGLVWASGEATCYATLYYFGHDLLIHVLATVVFDVLP